MNEPLQLVVFGGRRALNLVKAAKTRGGKLYSVDGCLRGSMCRRTEARMKATMADWRARLKRQAVAAYAEVRKDEVDDLVERILAQLELEGFSVDMVDEITPAMRQAFRDAGISALAEVNFNATEAIVNQVDTLASAYAANHGADLVTAISETTRQDMREIVTNAVDNGLSTYALAANIEEAFGFSDARSEMIARTELAFAHVNGNLGGWRASGVVEKKKWLVAQDNVCPECEALSGVEVDLDDTFESDDDEVDGPPLHPNCRCDVIAVLSEPEEEA